LLTATSYPAGSTYSVQAGSLPATALALGAGPAAIVTQAGTDSPAPVAANTGATVPADGPAVPFLVAAAGTGMGSYQVGPSLTLYPDATAWADASYAATLTLHHGGWPRQPPAPIGTASMTPVLVWSVAVACAGFFVLPRPVWRARHPLPRHRRP